MAFNSTCADMLSPVQRELLLQTPVLLGSLLAMALGHGWLTTTVEVMRLHAYFAQALLPGKSQLLQFPMITEDALNDAKGDDVTALASLLQNNKDRARSLLSAARHMGKLDVVDAQFRGELYSVDDIRDVPILTPFSYR